MQTFFKSVALFAAALTSVIASPVNQAPSTAHLNSKIGKIVPDNYIVVLKSELSTQAVEAHRSWASDIHSRRLRRRDDTSLEGITAEYGLNKFKGYAGSFDEETINQIKSSPEVAYVERDSYVVALDLIEQNSVPTWGLPRTSQAGTPAEIDFTKYTYDSTAGEGVTAYIIDTGILLTHEQFAGRATFGATFTTDGKNDGYGHGTHVAGTVAGSTYGIAKKAKLVSVKVLNASGSGTYAGVISGIQWTATDAVAKGIAKKSVANMSLGGGKNQAVNDAVAAAVSAGVTFAIAAGNSYGDDAQYYSPASEPTAITVGATDITDRMADFSNQGALVDIFGPGVSITSSWIGSDNKTTRSISGTSMATPHVVGVIALLLGSENLDSPAAVDARLKELAINAVSGPNAETTKLLLNTRAVPAPASPARLH